MWKNRVTRKPPLDPKQLQIEWTTAENAVPLEPPSPVSDADNAAPPTALPEASASRPKAPKPPPRRLEGNRIIARLPVPRPLPAVVAAGRFGRDEQGKPIRPAADEVRAITENQAENLIDMLDAMKPEPGKPAITERLPEAFGAIIAAYAQDFGERPARQLEAYARRQASLDEADRTDQNRCR